MTEEQSIELNGRLAECTVLLRTLVAANTWCIERMKRIDREQRQRNIQADAHLRLAAGRIAELRAREAAYDKARRDELKDACIRSGVWLEMMCKYKRFGDDAEG